MSSSSSSKNFVNVIVMPQDGVDLNHAEKCLKDVGGSVQRTMRSTPGLVARIPSGTQKALSEAGLNVIEDSIIKLLPGKNKETAEATGFMRTSSGNPQGPTESLDYNLPYRGKGVSIAILDSGVADHPDLRGRIVAFADAVEGRQRPFDGFGHGTHVAGDAAGDGSLSSGRFVGPAAAANIVGIRVLGGEDGDRLSDAVDCLVDGLNWMTQNKERYNIRVANLSLGIPLIPVRQDYYGNVTAVYDPLAKAIDHAVDAGIVVVAAAGNNGDEGAQTIAESPAVNPHVITVGALDTKGTPEPDDDTVAEFSSRGPTPFGESKPDVLAPGVNVMSLNAPGSELEHMNIQTAKMKQAIGQMSEREVQNLAIRMVRVGMAPPAILRIPPDELRDKLYDSMQPHKMAGKMGSSPAYMAMDGTSMASPIVAGIAADMIEANPSLKPAQVKEILMKTATRLPGESKYAQGAGVVNAEAAVKMAESMKKFPQASYQPQPDPQPKRHFWSRLWQKAS